jgi:hypothetical protein
MKHLLFPLFIVNPSTILATTFTDESDKFGLAGGNDACWFDFNNDGFVDICAGGKVFRNEKGQKFVYVADVGSSVAADFDNDGYLDLYSWGSRKLFRNIEGKRFEAIKLPDLPREGPSALRGEILIMTGSLTSMLEVMNLGPKIPMLILF